MQQVDDMRARWRKPLLDAVDRGSPGADEDQDEEDSPWRSTVDRFEDWASARGLDVDPSWADMMFRYSADYDATTYDDFDARHLRHALYEHFPRKVSCDASSAPEVLRSLRAFWEFAKNELHHGAADQCIAFLAEPDVEQRLRQELGNSQNFGMAKSFFMLGRKRGFDLSSQEGIDAWTRTYNEEQRSARRDPPSLPSDQAEKRRKKKLRKLKKAAQRRSRR
jgi:hypothetical protein